MPLQTLMAFKPLIRHEALTLLGGQTRGPVGSGQLHL